MKYLSPLRYPGGKARLAPFFKRVLTSQEKPPTQYAEPFAGGAGAALHLLAAGVVERVHLNDINAGIAAFWRTITNPDTADIFCSLIEKTPVTIDEWQKQREIYRNKRGDDLTLAFATFFLNRTNRSGILDARPIGGMSQNGAWGIDARFNKPALIKRVQAVAALGKQIEVTELDGVDFLALLEPLGDDVFVYADPPYVEQGGNLYLHAFDMQDHERLASHLLAAAYPWLLTYDDKELIWGELYRSARCAIFDIAHTAAIQHVGKETIVYGPTLKIPKELEITPGIKATWIDSQPLMRPRAVHA